MAMKRGSSVLSVTSDRRGKNCGSARRSEPGQGRTQAAVRDVMTNVIQALADRQWRDYRARQPGTCFADPGFALDLSDAYALQDAVAALRVTAGDRLVGYKVGCTGPEPCSSSVWRVRSEDACSKARSVSIGAW